MNDYNNPSNHDEIYVSTYNKPGPNIEAMPSTNNLTTEKWNTDNFGQNMGGDTNPSLFEILNNELTALNVMIIHTFPFCMLLAGLGGLSRVYNNVRAAGRHWRDNLDFLVPEDIVNNSVEDGDVGRFAETTHGAYALRVPFEISADINEDKLTYYTLIAVDYDNVQRYMIHIHPWHMFLFTFIVIFVVVVAFYPPVWSSTIETFEWSVYFGVVIVITTFFALIAAYASGVFVALAFLSVFCSLMVLCDHRANDASESDEVVSFSFHLFVRSFNMIGFCIIFLWAYIPNHSEFIQFLHEGVPTVALLNLIKHVYTIDPFDLILVTWLMLVFIFPWRMYGYYYFGMLSDNIGPFASTVLWAVFPAVALPLLHWVFGGLLNFPHGSFWTPLYWYAIFSLVARILLWSVMLIFGGVEDLNIGILHISTIFLATGSIAYLSGAADVGPYVGGFISLAWSSLSTLFGLPLAFVVYDVVKSSYSTCNVKIIRSLYLEDRFLFRACYFILAYFFCPIGPSAFALHHGLMLILVNVGLFLNPRLAPHTSVETMNTLIDMAPFTSLFVLLAQTALFVVCSLWFWRLATTDHIELEEWPVYPDYEEYLNAKKFDTTIMVLLIFLALVPVVLTLGLWCCTPVDLYMLFATMGTILPL